jgi:hypothetical protein
MNILPGTSRQSIQQFVLERWSGLKSANACSEAEGHRFAMRARGVV